MSPLTGAIIAALIAVNALYVAAEFSAVSVRQSRVQQRADQGDRLAKFLMPILRDAHALDRYIAACQIGITLSSLVLGAYGQAMLTPALAPVIAQQFGLDRVAALSTAAVVVLVLLTASQMILGELVPKSLALQFPTRLALWTVVPMRWSLWLLSWFIAVLNGSGTAILRMMGMYEASGHRHIHSPQEIELLIAESRDGGLLEPDEHRRLTQALKLGVRGVSAIMVQRSMIEAIEGSASADEVIRSVGESPYARLPVFEDSIDHVIGFVHVRDVAARALEPDRSWTARTVMRDILFIPQAMTADRALARMREERKQLAIVLDEFGGTAGLISVVDILDEVMGDVAGERQPLDAEPERLADGSLRLRGDLPVEEAARALGVRWEGGTARTIGGRIMETLGRAPESGEAVQISGVEVTVERVRRHSIQTVVIRPPRRPAFPAFPASPPPPPPAPPGEEDARG